LGSIDGSIHTLVDMSIRAVPTVIITRMGFVNNGGCECGCGAPCPAHHRWICPGDIGYACSTSLTQGNPPFFGDPARKAPCTWQPDIVVWTIRMSTFLINPVISFCVALAMSCYPVTEQIRTDISEQAQARREGKRFFDPISLEEVLTKSEHEELLVAYSQTESSMLQKRGGVSALARRFVCVICVGTMLSSAMVWLIYLHWRRPDYVLLIIPSIVSVIMWVSWTLLKVLHLRESAYLLRLHYYRATLREEEHLASKNGNLVARLNDRVISSLASWASRASWVSRSSE